MSGLLDGASLGMMRSYFNQLVHGTCSIVPLVDTNGVQSWPGPGVTVSCTKGNPARGGQNMVGTTAPASDTRFWVPVGTVVAKGYRLTFDGDGRTYKVTDLPSLHADELLRPVDCQEVRAPQEAV